MDLRTRLHFEFQRRNRRNPRYSVRAFARSLSLHHTTVIRLLSGSRGPSRMMIARVGRRLGLTPGQLRRMEQQEDASRILAAASAPGFRADCRWIATKTGVDLDDVNRALHLLIHERRLVMTSPTTWTIVAS